MTAKLTDIFNTADAASRSLAQRLQQVLDALPEKLGQMPAGKDILLVQVPVDHKYPPSLTHMERAAAVQAAQARTTPVVHAFEKVLMEKFPQVDASLTASNSIWGEQIFVNIVTSQPSVSARLIAAGVPPENPHAVMQGMQNLLGEKGMTDYLLMQQSLQMIQSGMVQARVAGMDPDKMGPVRFSGFGPKPEKYHGRYTFWDVDTAWPKPALLPEFAHLAPKPQDAAPKSKDTKRKPK